MAEYYNANEVELSIEKQLKICNWKKVNDKYFEIELPVVLYFNYQRLILNIYPVDDGYYIYDDGKSFLEYSMDNKHYFDLFIQNDNNYHFEIKMEKDYIYKKYKFDYSLISAIDEFIRFFIDLDQYIRNNDIC